MNDIEQNDPKLAESGEALVPDTTSNDDVNARVTALQEEMGQQGASPEPAPMESPAVDAQIAPVAEASLSADVIRDEDKIMLILAYILPFIPFFTVKDSDYVKWHANQGMALLITCIVGSIVIGFIPVIGCIAAPLFSILITVACVMGIVNALKPARWEIPLVASVSKKLFQ